MKSELLKPTAWLIAGVAVAAFFIGRAFDTVRLLRAHSQVSARVIETFEEEREDDRHVAVVSVAVYEFFVGHRRFMGKTDGVLGSFAVGDRLSILYYPRNPAFNRAAGDRSPVVDSALVLVFSGLFSYFAITVNFPTVRRLLLSRSNPKNA